MDQPLQDSLCPVGKHKPYTNKHQLQVYLDLGLIIPSHHYEEIYHRILHHVQDFVEQNVILIVQKIVVVSTSAVFMVSISQIWFGLNITLIQVKCQVILIIEVRNQSFLMKIQQKDRKNAIISYGIVHLVRPQNFPKN